MAKKKAAPATSAPALITYDVTDPCIVPKMPGKEPNTDFALNPSRCDVFGVKKYLGRGAFSRVYESANDPARIVKFTRDASDAAALADIGNAPESMRQNLIRVDDVAFLPDAPAKPTYAILAERVAPLPESDWAAAHSATGAIVAKADYLERKIMQDDVVPPSAIKAMKTAAKKSCLARTADRKADQKRLCSMAVEMIDAYSQLLDLGIFTVDIHAQNWGVRDGRPVLFDIGLSNNRGIPSIRIAGASDLTDSRWSPPWVTSR